MTSINRILHTVPLVLGMAVLPAGAQGVFKCVGGEGIAYQSAPCGSGQVQLRLAIAAQPSPAAAIEPVSAVSRPPSLSQTINAARSNTWPWRRMLTVGMSDDEVLNLRGWGIPTRISRARTPGEWREEWIYTRPAAEERRLQFVNAKLVDIVDTPPPAERVAVLASSLREQLSR